MEILYEDNHLLIVNKPALVPTMGAESGETTVLGLARDYVRARWNKPGNVFLGVVSRLDSHVTGALVFARTSKAASRLSEQFREHEVGKTYWALVACPEQRTTGRMPGQPTDRIRLEHWLTRDDARRQTCVSNKPTASAQHAILEYRELARESTTALLEVQLLTGRRHQIRAQLSHVSMPIRGDIRYGGSRNFSPGIALHSRILQIKHPVRDEQIRIVAPLPESWHPWHALWKSFQ